MKKNTLSCFMVPLLLIAASIFLFINYVKTVNGGVRIPSEMGYYFFLIVVVVSSILFAIMQQAPFSRKTTLKYGLQINLILVVCVCVDMVLHILARELTHSPNTSPFLPGGIQFNMPLIQSAWKIYGARFITVLLLGNLILLGIMKLRQLRSR